MKFKNRSILVIIVILTISIVLAFFLFAPEEPKNWSPYWKGTSSLQIARQGVAAVEVNGFIYALGGARGEEWLKSTEYARILKDGSLSPWKEGPPMNEARGYLAAVTKDGYIYVIGGGHGEAGKVLLRTVERSRILPDGSLSPWELEENGMIFPRRCAKAVLIDDTIYAIGGFSGDMLNNVEHSKIKADGTIGEWLEEPEKMNEMRYISGVKNVHDTVYVAGSHDQFAGEALRDVEWSRVVDEAGFGKWQKTSPMNVKRFGLGMVYHNGNLYAFGGINSPRFLDSIETAPIKPEGGVGQWRMLKSKLTSKRAMMAVVIYKDWVYSIGGSDMDKVSKVVEYALFNKDGEVGSWFTPDELAAVEAARAKAAVPTLPFGGKVVEIRKAKPYVYIKVELDEVSEEKHLVWIAGPEGDYSVGDHIRFSSGPLMGDFFSKKLNLRFKEVLFVQEIRKDS